MGKVLGRINTLLKRIDRDIEELKFLVEVEFVNPGFMNLNGKRYIVPHWIEVDGSVTYDNINDYIPDNNMTEPNPAVEIETHFVRGSGENFYTITTTQNGKHTCNCLGFQYRHTCKHINEFLRVNGY